MSKALNMLLVVWSVGLCAGIRLPHDKQSSYKDIKRQMAYNRRGIGAVKPDDEKNANRDNYKHYYIIPCKYYKALGRTWNGCSYLGIITDDMVFDDQCKMCHENYDDDDE